MDSEMSPELYSIWDEAKTHIEQGDYNKAIEVYKYVLIQYSDNNVAAEYANAYLGDIFLTLRQLDLAESHIKKAISYMPENPGYHYLLGFIYSIKNQWEEAIQEFEIAVDKEPNNDEYLRGLGWAIRCAGDKVKGLAYLHKAIDLAPTNVNTLTDLATAYLSDLQFHKAHEYAEKATLIDPGNEFAREVLDNIDLFQRALEQFGEPQ